MNTKDRTYKLFSLLMATYLMVISMGFTIDKHYCQGELKTISVFGKAKSCHDLSGDKKPDSCKMKSKSCHMANMSCNKMMSSKDEKNNCCENKSETISFKTDSEIAPIISLKSLQIDNIVLVTVSAPLFKSDETIINHRYLNYRPPSVKTNLLILFQSFLC